MRNKVDPLLLITVELSRQNEYPQASPADLDTARGRLLSALQRGGLSATWVAVDPGLSASARSLMNSSPAQHLAIFGDTQGAANRDLEQRVSRARDAGVRLGHVILRNSDASPAGELLSKQGLVAIRLSTKDQPTAAEFSSPAAGDGAIFTAPPAWCLREVEGIWHEWRLQAAVKSQLARGGMHLFLATGQLAAASRRTWNYVDRLLQNLGKLQRNGRLTGLLLGKFVDDADSKPAHQTQRSILRAA